MKRRFTTKYYRTHGGPYVSQGHSNTPQTAVRSAIYRIFCRMYGPTGFAIISDKELEVDLLIVQLSEHGISAELTPEAAEYAPPTHKMRLRRVK